MSNNGTKNRLNGHHKVKSPPAPIAQTVIDTTIPAVPAEDPLLFQIRNTALKALHRLVANSAAYEEFVRDATSGSGLDPAGRNLERECGHPEIAPTPAQYDRMYLFNTLGRKVVNALPDACHAVWPELYEDEDPKTLTPFEQDFAEVRRLHPDFWSVCHRADRLSRKHRCGGLLLGVADGKAADEPMGRTRLGPKGLLFLRPGSEVEFEPQDFETGMTARNGWPNAYKVQVGDPDGDAGTTEVVVHHSRVLHAADNLGASQVFGHPAMEPVFSRLLDLRKVLGSSAEMFYKGAFPGIAFQTLAELAGRTSMDKASLQEEWSKYQQGIQRFLALDGLEAVTLKSNIVDPTNFAMLQVQMIAADIDTPVKVLLGVQSGQMAGQDDMGQWQAKVVGRQTDLLSPRYVELGDRLVAAGVCRPNKKPLKVWWPEVNLQSPKDQADTAVKLTQALLQFVTSGAELIFPQEYFLSEVLRLPQALVDKVMAKAGQAPHTKAAWKDPKANGSGAGKASASAKRGGTSRNGNAKRK